jgi:hypothetical protein
MSATIGIDWRNVALLLRRKIFGIAEGYASAFFEAPVEPFLLRVRLPHIDSDKPGASGWQWASRQ